MEVIAFAVSAALAQILTNLDNLAVLLALIPLVGLRPSMIGYLCAQVVILAGSLILALWLTDVAANYVGWLGIVPVALGLNGLRRQFRGGDTSHQNGLGNRSSTLALVALFLSLSADSFAVMIPLLAESAPVYRGAGVIGACLAALGLGVCAVLASGYAGAFAGRFERLGPYVMILAGLYVLSNSGTDLV
ncbi:MAG: hypothetical protein AAF408_08670 [Pseudomonadota bacterium]